MTKIDLKALTGFLRPHDRPYYHKLSPADLNAIDAIIVDWLRYISKSHIDYPGQTPTWEYHKEEYIKRIISNISFNAPGEREELALRLQAVVDKIDKIHQEALGVKKVEQQPKPGNNGSKG